MDLHVTGLYCLFSGFLCSGYGHQEPMVFILHDRLPFHPLRELYLFFRSCQFFFTNVISEFAARLPCKYVAKYENQLLHENLCI